MPPKELWEAYSNRTVRPSVRPSVPLSCPVHISYILWGRNSKFGVWIHLGMAECRVPFLWEAYSNRTVRPSVRPSVPLSCPVHISSILQVGIPNLVCGYILGWRSVAYLFRVTVTLTSDLVFRIIVSGAYLLY